MKFEEQLLKTKPSEMYMDVLTGLELSVSMQLVFLFLCVCFFSFLVSFKCCNTGQIYVPYVVDDNIHEPFGAFPRCLSPVQHS